MRSWTTTLDRDPPGVPQLIEDKSNRRRAHSRQCSLQVASPELGRCLFKDVIANAVLLTADRVAGGSDALLEALVRAGEDGCEV